MKNKEKRRNLTTNKNHVQRKEHTRNFAHEILGASRATFARVYTMGFLSFSRNPALFISLRVKQQREPIRCNGLEAKMFLVFVSSAGDFLSRQKSVTN